MMALYQLVVWFVAMLEWLCVDRVAAWTVEAALDALDAMEVA